MSDLSSSSDNISDANYYIKKKIDKYEEKVYKVTAFKDKIEEFSTYVQEVDQKVADMFCLDNIFSIKQNKIEIGAITVLGVDLKRLIFSKSVIEPKESDISGTKDYIKKCYMNDPILPIPNTNSSWVQDALRRGWGPISFKEYYRRTRGMSTYGAQGTGNPKSGNSSWNQWDVSKAVSPGNLTGTNSSIFEAAAEAGKGLVSNTIRNTVRPRNIGVGTWNTYIEAEAATAASKFGTVAKVAKGAGYVAIGVDVGFGIYDNVQAGAPTNKIVSDAFIDTAFGGGGLLTSMAVGGGLGTLGCPVVGTVIGAVAAGVVYMVCTEVWEPGGQSLKDRAKEGMYNSIK